MNKVFRRSSKSCACPPGKGKDCKKKRKLTPVVYIEQPRSLPTPIFISRVVTKRNRDENKTKTNQASTNNIRNWYQQKKSSYQEKQKVKQPTYNRFEQETPKQNRIVQAFSLIKVKPKPQKTALEKENDKLQKNNNKNIIKEEKRARIQEEKARKNEEKAREKEEKAREKEERSKNKELMKSLNKEGKHNHVRLDEKAKRPKIGSNWFNNFCFRYVSAWDRILCQCFCCFAAIFIILLIVANNI